MSELQVYPVHLEYRSSLTRAGRCILFKQWREKKKEKGRIITRDNPLTKYPLVVNLQ